MGHDGEELSEHLPLEKWRSAGRFQRERSLTNQSLEQTASTSKRPLLIRLIFGDQPWFTPGEVPLDLLFFRRLFARLQRRSGTHGYEMPNEVLVGCMDRLYSLLNFEQTFDARAFDVDHTGSISWSEFVRNWRRSKLVVQLTLAERIFFAIEQPTTCILGACGSCVLLLMIFASCLCLLLGTLSSFQRVECSNCEPVQLEIFDSVELVCILVFTVEYVVRISLSPWCRSELHSLDSVLEAISEQDTVTVPSPAVRFITFVARPMNIVDLLVVLPWYLDEVMGLFKPNFMVFRVLRLARLLRLAKLGRYFEELNIIVRVFDRSLRALYVLTFYLVLGICFTSALMYYVEGGAWDADEEDYMVTRSDGTKVTSPFKSIPHAFWWSTVTCTTVGYGDVVPFTALGRLVAGFTMVVGILVLAMPISVVTLNFGQVWSEFNNEARLQAEAEILDRCIVAHALESLERRTQLLVELYISDTETYDLMEFLGEAWVEELPVVSDVGECQDVSLKLCPNSRKASKGGLKGTVHVGLAWRPAPQKRKGIHGELEVTVKRAEGMDCTLRAHLGCTAIVHCWPRPPPDNRKQQGAVVDEKAGSSTKFRTTCVQSLEPIWDETISFEFDWPEDADPNADTEIISCGSSTEKADHELAASGGRQADRVLHVHQAVEAQARELKQLHASVEELKEALLRAVGGRKVSANAGLPASVAHDWATLPGAPLHPSGVEAVIDEGKTSERLSASLASVGGRTMSGSLPASRVNSSAEA